MEACTTLEAKANTLGQPRSNLDIMSSNSGILVRILHVSIVIIMYIFYVRRVGYENVNIGSDWHITSNMSEFPISYINMLRADIRALKFVFKLACANVDGKSGLDGMRRHAKAYFKDLEDYNYYRQLALYSSYHSIELSDELLKLCNAPRPVVANIYLCMRQEIARIVCNRPTETEKITINLCGEIHGPYSSRYNGHLIVELDGW